MKDNFRQSIAWLHTWAGLLTGWVLFFVFVTGTFGFVNAEVDQWMRPELPPASSLPSPAMLVPIAERALESKAPDAINWRIFMPGKREPVFAIGWLTPAGPNGQTARYTREILDPATGEPVTGVRETGGGGGLYYMHHALRYMPYRGLSALSASAPCSCLSRS